MAHLMLEESVEKLDWGLKEELSVWFIHMAGKLVLAVSGRPWCLLTQFSPHSA